MHEGGGDEGGRTTGAKADFCLTAADTMLAGEKEKTPEEEEQLEGREVEEAMVGLEGTTGRRGVGGERGQEETLRHFDLIMIKLLLADFLGLFYDSKSI